MRWREAKPGEVHKLKERGGETLAHVLAQAEMSSFSEAALAREWCARLGEDKTFYNRGWYDPPPGGTIVLCGKKDDAYARIDAPSFRPESLWPKDDIICGNEDILTVYVSPVCRASGLMGDFGLSLYRGTDPAIRDHFEAVLETSLRIARFARAGMPFSELYDMALAHIRDQGYTNEIESHTDRAGTNIGHTIPLSFATDPTREAAEEAKDFASLRTVLSAGRIFISGVEKRVIEPDMAFTIEPRLALPGLPRIFYHLTVVMDAGELCIAHGFYPVLEAFGMERLAGMLDG